jgi:beta-N-acetylhexosaminidase
MSALESSLACSLGIRQAKLDADLRALLRETRPWSFILFREACVSRAQVRALCAALRETVARDAIIYIDQEGGRVARLKPPEWPTWPAAAAYGKLHAANAKAGAEAVRLGHRLIAHELRAIGVNGDFAPVLDTPVDGADPIIGDRAFARESEAIATLARAALEGLHAGGVTGCVKHLPGHGRAEADSHLALPTVSASAAELERDIAPFAALADAESAMTAHIVYEAWDRTRPATCSPDVIKHIIRERIGFNGLLMSDDLDMKALEYAFDGDLGVRAKGALDAGCDVVLQCSGLLSEMAEVAKGCRTLSGAALERARAVEAIAARAPDAFDADAGWARFRQLMTGAA